MRVSSTLFLIWFSTLYKYFQCKYSDSKRERLRQVKLVKRNLLLGNQKQAALLAGDLEILHLFLTQVTRFTHSNSCREEDPGNEAMKGGGEGGAQYEIHSGAGTGFHSQKPAQEE